MDKAENSIRNRLNNRRNGKTQSIDQEKMAQVLEKNFATAIKVNLQDYGYSQAGRHLGEPDALKNHFERIRNGQIIDENYNDEKQLDSREQIDSKISGINEEITVHEADARKLRLSEIKGVKLEIEKKNGEMDQIDLDLLQNEVPVKRDVFNLLQYGITLLFLTVFMYFFYVSAFHSALFRDIASELSNADTGILGAILNTVFNVGAYKDFTMHWVAPIVFFGFSMVLHIVWESASRMRWIMILGVLLFILTADGLIAFFIEMNNHTIEILMGTADETWKFYTSPIFYMVLILGFFSSVGWSIILYQFKAEFPSRDRRSAKIAKRRKAIIKARIYKLEQKITALEADIIDLEKEVEILTKRIEDLEVERGEINYSIPILKKSITTFYNGWLSYINGLQDADAKRARCTEITENYLQTLN